MPKLREKETKREGGGFREDHDCFSNKESSHQEGEESRKRNLEGREYASSGCVQKETAREMS